MKSYKWWFFFPGGVYGYDFDFEYRVTEQEARAYVRELFGIKRLWNGTQVWVG